MESENLYGVGRSIELIIISFFLIFLGSIFESFFETITITNQFFCNSMINQNAFITSYSNMTLENLIFKDLIIKGGYLFSITNCFNISFYNINVFNINYGGILQLISSSAMLTRLNIKNNVSIINSFSMIYVTGISNFLIIDSSNISYCASSGNGGVYNFGFLLYNINI